MTPEDMRDELSAGLTRRRADITKRRNYYDGIHPFANAPDETSDDYERFAVLGQANLCANVVDATVERLTVRGLSLNAGDSELDADVWRRFWLRNDLDAKAPLAFEESAKTGWAYLMASPGEEDADATVTAEDPMEMIVAYEAGRHLDAPVAAFKQWKDGSTDYATLQTPEAHYYWQRTGSAWIDWGGPNDLGPQQDNAAGEVTVRELPCRPRLDGMPQPELSRSVLLTQDRINKRLFDSIVIGEFQAFPQRVAIGIDIPTDSAGAEVNPLKAGPERVWALNKDPDDPNGSPQVFQLSPADLTQGIKVVESDIRLLATQSRTPLVELAGDLINVSGEVAAHALNSGHVMKVRRHQRTYGASIEDMVRLWMRLSPGFDGVDGSGCEVRWLDPEMRTLAEKADAATKLMSIGFPFRAVAEMLGYSDAAILELESQQAASRLALLAAAQPDDLAG